MSLAQNVTQNMAEDLTYLIGYSMVNKWINELLATEFPDEVDDQGRPTINLAREVISGGASYLLMSGMIELIRREEKMIQYLFVAGEALIMVLYARNKGYLDGLWNKVRGSKGVRAINRMKVFQSQSDPTNSFISQVLKQMDLIMQGRNSGSSVTDTIQSSNSTMDTALRREAQNLKFASANNESFSKSLMLKFATGTFTETDKVILQKVIGRSDFATVPLNVDELNMVHEFMFVTDSNGKLTGLTKAFVSLLNGLGYVHKV